MMSAATMLQFLVLAVALAPQLAAGEYWNFGCSGANYTPNRGYERNLQLLARRLPAKVASTALFFSEVAIGPPLEQLHALALCRRDANASVCKRCIADAFQEARAVCPFKKGVVLLFDYCTIRLSSKNFLMPFNGEAFLKYNNWTAQSSDFRKYVTGLVYAVSNKAAVSKQRFATGEQDLADGSKLFSFSQCIPTLSPSECKYCLRDLTGNDIFEGLPGGRISSISCELRSDRDHFYFGNPMFDIPAVTSKGKGKHHHHHVLLWILLGAAVAGIVLAAIVVLLIWSRKRRSRNAGGQKAILFDDEKAGEGGSGTVCKVLHSALTSFQEIIELAGGRTVALFLDYDGTLLDNPSLAFMSDEMPEVVRQAAAVFPTSIVSGQAREKVFEFVKIKNLNYTGSHGLDIMTPVRESASTSDITEAQISYQPAQEFLEAINKIFKTLVAATEHVQGANVENNVYNVTVHYRNVHEEQHDLVRKIVEKILEDEKVLEDKDFILSKGHMNWEVRPPVPWNKGDAVAYLLEKLGLHDQEKVFPIYIGDDKTDEDAFKVLREQDNGIGILVLVDRRETEAFYSLKDPCDGIPPKVGELEAGQSISRMKIGK